MHLQHMCLAAALAMTPLALADELHVPSQYPTIQAAIAASQAGDEVVLADGVFTGAGNRDINMPAHAITLRSASGDPARTSIEPGYGHRALQFAATPSEIEVRGITVRNLGYGSLEYGGAVTIYSASPTFRNCVFDRNAVDSDHWECGGNGEALGGAIFMDMSNARFEDCVFSNNSAEAHSCLVFPGFPPVGGQFAQGGAIAVWEGEPVFIRCTFTDNYVGAHLGYGNGGAIAGSPALLVDCTFTANEVRAEWSYGGALNGNADIDGCTFIGNRVSGFDAVGGAIAGSFQARNTLFQGNDSGVSGGAVVLWSDETAGEPELVDCRFIGNSAYGRGSAIWLHGSATMTSVVIADNAGPTWCVGAVRIAPGAQLRLNSSTIWNNGPVCDGNAIILDTAAGMVTRLDVSNSIVFAGGARPITVGGSEAIVSITYSDIERGWAGAGNISADPLLIDPAAGDWRPGPGSPVIDAGNNTAIPGGILTDLAGLPRFVDDPATPDTGVPGGAGGSAIVDMGAYEYQADFCYADCDASGELDFLDFLCFQEAFAAADPYADCDGSGESDFFDFLCFQNAFAVGCP